MNPLVSPPPLPPPPLGLELQLNPSYSQERPLNKGHAYEIPVLKSAKSLDLFPGLPTPASDSGREGKSFIYTESGVYEEPVVDGGTIPQPERAWPEGAWPQEDKHIYEDPELLT